MITVVGNLKGGAGKSTLSFNLVRKKVMSRFSKFIFPMSS